MTVVTHVINSDCTLTMKDEEQLKYASVNFELIKPALQSATLATESSFDDYGLEKSMSKQTRQIQPSTENILSEVEGVILSVEENETVKIKLYPSTIAYVPDIIFEEQASIKMGQHIKYQIIKDREGYRYQKIVAIEKKASHPDKELTLKLLNEIKFRDE